MRKLVLQFVGDKEYELFESCFVHPLIEEERRCVRGKRSGAYRGFSTFQWTKAVQAVSLLFIEAAIRKFQPAYGPLLVGPKGSPASSLDYAIDKQTEWLTEMFGWTPAGTGVTKRLFLRSNPGQRYQGPVGVSINLNCLAYEEIEILLNYEVQHSLLQLTHLKEAIQQRAPEVCTKKVPALALVRRKSLLGELDGVLALAD